MQTIRIFRLATNETYTNRTTGERVSNTEWHNIVVRNKGAEICEKYLKKGDKVYVEGRIKTRKWQDESGNERYSTEVQCTDFTFLTPKEASGMPQQSGSQPQAAQSKAAAVPKASPSPVSPGYEDDDEDDLPF